MSASALPRMTADEFIAWAMEQPETEHYELVAGEVVAMAPERMTHVRTKFHLARLLANALEAKELPCEAFVEGLGIRVDDATFFIPDILVRCGPPPAGDPLYIDDPLIVVEVLSPSSRSRDTNRKLSDYFRLPSLRHYLIVATDIRTVIHHQRDEAGTILTRIVRDGALRLDPPGIELRDMFG